MLYHCYVYYDLSKKKLNQFLLLILFRNIFNVKTREQYYFYFNQDNYLQIKLIFSYVIKIIKFSDINNYKLNWHLFHTNLFLILEY